MSMAAAKIARAPFNLSITIDDLEIGSLSSQDPKGSRQQYYLMFSAIDSAIQKARPQYMFSTVFRRPLTALAPHSGFDQIDTR